MKADTIAAIATALSDSGIGIIRISGADAVQIGDRIFFTKSGKKRLNDSESHKIHYGYIVEFSNKNPWEGTGKNWKDFIVDEVMVSVMRAPHTYTKEDTVEINCHGGVFVVQRILETVIKAGARLAEPGEFTKRAFLNGRIDLSRAEAVMDLIHAQNEYALSASLSQLKGNLSHEVKELRSEIIYEIAFIESALDDPEHISLEGYSESLFRKTESLLQRINTLISTADDGKRIKEGLRMVIVGKPNAGKSSLMNLLSGEEKAIVTNIAGTTRDVLEEYVNIQGFGFHIIDTAGIRSTDDAVEKIGVDKAKRYASEADLILYMVDVSVELDENDRNILSMIKDKKVLVLLNKSDLKNVVTEEKMMSVMKEIMPDFEPPVMIKISTLENTGIDLFMDTIKNMFFQGYLKSNRQIVITNLRHKEALLEAFDSLKMVKKSIEVGMPEDFYSIDLMNAYSALGKITGEEVGEDLVNEIFSKFCMGK